MSAVLQERPATTDSLLKRARDAWREMQHAQSEMRRLSGYRAMTDGMKLDYNRASRTYNTNYAIHEQIMRGDL
jgi:hypothetical protein